MPTQIRRVTCIKCICAFNVAITACDNLQFIVAVRCHAINHLTHFNTLLIVF